MPPKFRYTKEEIIQAALDITREGGISSVTAKSIGDRLNSSVKLVFGQFKNMDELKTEVIKAADALYQKHITDSMNSGKYPRYKASGMAYISFAKEERELFRLLFMRDRSKEPREAVEDTSSLDPIISEIQKITGYSRDDAFMFHMEMWVYVHGIASMIATSYLDWDMDTISEIISDAYSGLKHQFDTTRGKA